jgi:hypothetical protein
MHFIFKHVEFSTYRDERGKSYHYTQRSPNFQLVRKGARVLCYQKESNSIFAIAEVKRISRVRKGNELNFFAIYGNYRELKEPLVLTPKLRSKLGLRDLRLPSPGIIPISGEVFERLVELVKRDHV